jgi:hypothetical protein
MEWWWYPLIAIGVLALAAIARLFVTRNSATVEMPGGETIFDAPRRE